MEWCLRVCLLGTDCRFYKVTVYISFHLSKASLIAKTINTSIVLIVFAYSDVNTQFAERFNTYNPIYIINTDLMSYAHSVQSKHIFLTL